jgi:hypothetical protein
MSDHQNLADHAEINQLVSLRFARNAEVPR